MDLQAELSSALHRRRAGKKNTLFVGQGLLAVSFLSSWVCFTPAAPWLMAAPFVFLAPGLTCFMLMGGSILGDVCDQDELEHGMRREGMFGAAAGFVGKFAFSLVTVLNGYQFGNPQRSQFGF